MSTVSEVIAKKGSEVVSVRETATVLEATQKMNDARIGAVAVVDSDMRLIGLFTERDVLRRVVAMRRDPEETIVGEVMTRELVTCEPSDDLNDIAEVMRDRRVRHVPCVSCRDSQRLCGMISIGDVNAYHVEQVEAQVQQLSEYVYGRG